MSEMEMWSQKFDAYALEKSSVQDILAGKKPQQTGGARANSVGNRLYRQKHSNSDTNTIDS